MDTKLIWKNVDAVCFDVDSTVTEEEGIDELAKFCNKGTDVANLTNKAMAGSMTFQESLTLRLNIMQPSLSQVKDFIEQHPPSLTPGIKSLIALLHAKKIPVYLISGGFRSIIKPVADELEVPDKNIFANRLKFYFTGEYAGFDENEATSASGGKSIVVKNLIEKYGYKNLVMIGDGVTDLETCPPAKAFIGFGGNVIREPVQSKAEWFVTDFKDLIDVFSK